MAQIITLKQNDVLKWAMILKAELKIYINGNSKRSLCFVNELGLDYTDCFQIKNVYKKNSYILK